MVAPKKKSKKRIKKTGEVFTPTELVNELLDKFLVETWSDKTQTFLDPSCGDGNFLVEVKKRLMKGLKEVFPNENEREAHILNNMIFGVDIMPDNVARCRERLGIKVNKIRRKPIGPGYRNIKCANFLTCDLDKVFERK